MTRVGDTHVPDEDFTIARGHFTEKEIVDLTMAIVAINGWNRLNVAFRTVPGGYRPVQRKREGVPSAQAV